MSQSLNPARRSTRPRSPSTDPDNNVGARDILISRRRKKKTPTIEIPDDIQTAYYTLGQYLARCFDPEIPIREVIIYAKLFINGSHEVSEVYDESSRRYNIEAWNTMACVLPDIQDELRELNLAELQSRVEKIKDGIGSARCTDANRLKVNTADYTPLDPKEKVILSKGRSKADRGFNHPVLGRLLLPVNLLGEWDANRNRVLNKIQNGDYRLTAVKFPAFLYEEGSFDPDNILSGLFRGHFLIRCCKAIFIGPMSAMNAPAQVVVGNNCVANRLKITTISPQIIAYICMQARFALSSADVWSYRDGEFNYKIFFQRIVELFEHGGHNNEWATATLEWWNKQVFGNKDGNPTLSTSTNIDDNDDNDFFALAEIQAARRVALNGARGLTERTGCEDPIGATPSVRATTPLPSTPLPSTPRSGSPDNHSNRPATLSPVTPQPEPEDCHPKFSRGKSGKKVMPSTRVGRRRGKV